ncbi:Protein hcp1 [Burkholderiaceae bacterium]|nr:Protein hcp1 [Burkholderiaceae bacterium]
MSSPDRPLARGPRMDSADACLAVVGKKQGALKGECELPGHVDEITVFNWKWGVSSPTFAGTGQAAGRRVHDMLQVEKGVDRSTTMLLNALATNEELKSVTLSLRKAGADAEDFFTITLERARVAACNLVSDDAGDLHEEVKFAFQKVAVQYFPQQRSGQRGGAFSFEDELSEAA